MPKSDAVTEGYLNRGYRESICNRINRCMLTGRLKLKLSSFFTYLHLVILSNPSIEHQGIPSIVTTPRRHWLLHEVGELFEWTNDSNEQLFSHIPQRIVDDIQEKKLPGSSQGEFLCSQEKYKWSAHPANSPTVHKGYPDWPAPPTT